MYVRHYRHGFRAFFFGFLQVMPGYMNLFDKETLRLGQTVWGMHTHAESSRRHDRQQIVVIVNLRVP